MPFPEIDPVLLHLGPLQVRWYAVAYLAAFVLGWLYCMQLAKLEHESPKPKDFDGFLTAAIIGTIVGGRLGYVLFYQPAFYLVNPGEILAIWKGGMSFHGGLIGMMVMAWRYCDDHKIKLLKFGDILCSAAPIGLFFGRLANFINGELYGRITDAPWGVIFPNGGPLPRHPSQLYEAVCEGLLLFIVLWLCSRNDFLRKRVGLRTGVFFFGYGVCRFVIEFFREPDRFLGLVTAQLTMGQLLCLPMILFGLILIIWTMRKKPKLA